MPIFAQDELDTASVDNKLTLNSNILDTYLVSTYSSVLIGLSTVEMIITYVSLSAITLTEGQLEVSWLRRSERS